jgi:hypothetical protein
MTKKIVRLTESDLERIVRRVIKESMGVAFGGEQNGLKIKKMDAKEQMSPNKPSAQSSMTQPKPVDQAIMTKIKGTFPTPVTDDAGKMSFVRNNQNFGKYDTLVKYLANTEFGRMAKVMDISNAKDMTTTNMGTKSNDMAMKALYDGTESILKNGYANSLKDLTKYGNMGENLKIISADYLEKLGIRYSA